MSTGPKHAPTGPARKLETLFPTTVINKEILSFLPAQDIFSFAATTRSADKLVAQTGIWAEKIKSEFKVNVQSLMPANRQQLLLPHTRIYRHLVVLSKLEKEERSNYTIDDPAVFQWALSEDVTDRLFLNDYLRKAAGVGNLALVQWLMAPGRGAQRVNPNQGTLNRAVRSGNLALVQWLMAPERREQRVLLDIDTFKDAARAGNLALVQWLVTVAPFRRSLVLYKAARSGNLALVQWLITEASEWQHVDPDAGTLSAAAESGNLALVRWLIMEAPEGQRVNPDDRTLRDAAGSGNFALVRWLTTEAPEGQRVNPTVDDLSAAARRGDLALVRWLIVEAPEGQRVNPDAGTRGKSGNLALARWLITEAPEGQRVDPDAGTLSAAARSGNLALARWLITEAPEGQRVNPDAGTLSVAAESGNLALVRWLIMEAPEGQRVNPNAQALYLAARRGDLALVRWLIVEAPEGQRVNPTVDDLSAAARRGDLALVRWLIVEAPEGQRMNPDAGTLSAAARSGNLALVRWLMTGTPQGCCTNRPFMGVFIWEARNSSRSLQLCDPDLVQWIVQEMEETCFTMMLAQNAENHVKQPLSSESKSSTGTAHLVDSKEAPILDRPESKHPIAEGVQTSADYPSSSSSTSTALFSSMVAGKPLLASEQKGTKQTQPASTREERAPSSTATTVSVDELVSQSGGWQEKIKNEFKVNIQTVIPANRRALLLPGKDIYQHLNGLSKLANKARSQYTPDDPALFQKALSEDVSDYILLHDYLDKAARVGNLALVQWLMAPERAALHVAPSVETLSYAAESGNLALVQWLMAPERGAQRVSPDDDTLRSAAISENLVLVQWLIAPERGEQHVEFSSGLISEIRKGLGGEVIQQWVEQMLQLREASTAAPISIPHRDSQTQRPLDSESKTFHAGDSRAQQPLGSKSKPFSPARLPDSKAPSVSDSKLPNTGGTQTPVGSSSSSSVSTTAHSSSVIKTGSPLHSGGQQKTAAASSQQNQTDVDVQAGDSAASSSSSNQPKSPGPLVK